MALGEENWWDKDFQNTADLIVNGRSFENQEVMGDKREPMRRDVFPGNDFRERYGGDYPDSAVVEWQGQRYMADLSFRTRAGGGSVPMYEFYLEG